MSAPNLLRVGTAENIFVECQDCTGGDIGVIIRIPVGEFSKDPKMKQYVYLQAQFPGRLLEKVVLVSFQSGYIFIQTDKTLYTPKSRVHYRIFALTPGLQPVERETQSDAFVAIEIVVFHGVWKVVAMFSSNPQQSYSAEFEVKEYVLPSFEVKLTADIPFLYVDSKIFNVSIEARYLFNENVDGQAYVVFGFMEDGQKHSFPGSIQRVLIEKGNGVATLKREHITDTVSDILDLVGKDLFVSVSVLTESGSEIVEAELRTIKIVTSPYTILFKKTPKFYKPGMSFDVVVEVVNPDGTPAQGVPLVIDPGQVRGNTEPNGMARLSINPQGVNANLVISAETNVLGLRQDRQAKATMVALPYITTGGNYIHIGVTTQEVELGLNMQVNLILSNRQQVTNDITYLILSRGQLIDKGRYKARGEALITLTIPVKKEMLPSFRIVAYYHTSNSDVVSDSVWVDVKDSCMGSLKLEPTRNTASYEPGRLFGLKVTGDPGAIVGLVAVDKGVYVLNNKYRLTMKKVWDTVEKHDTGCTPGGGGNSMGVFYDAGLLFESSTASGTPYRQVLECPASSRSKRATTIMNVTITLVNKYKDKQQRDCCMDGMKETPLSYNCERRSEYIDNDPACVEAFVHCCKTMEGLRAERQQEELLLARRICVGKPLEVIVRKDFFIDLRLPDPAAVRGEQIEIKAILHNYTPESVNVRVDLLEPQHVCSAAFKKGRFQQIVNVGPQTTRSVPFVIMPMKEGLYPIEVKAAVRGSSLNDGIRRKLRVVIYVTGVEQVSSLVENGIGGQAMRTLIQKPYGCGEQNLAAMTLPVIAATYLDKTNQWEAVGFKKRDQAIDYIKTGYNTQIGYRKADEGSFAVFKGSKSSTWLTAYVVKVFVMAKPFVGADNIICDAVRFLILNTQQPDGSFREVGYVYDGAMRGDVDGKDSDVSMTAFCVIAMQESRTLCDGTVYGLTSSIAKAVAFLERRLPQLTYSYAVAIASYALANENKLNRGILSSFVSRDLSHWPVNKGHIYTLEATAYALLALVKAKAFEDAKPVVRWFNQQQYVGGGYGSTQTTIMVYQAIAEYWTNVEEPEYNLDVDILWSGRSKPDTFNFKKANHYTTRTSKINDIDQSVTVTAMGTGEATLTMVALYYSLLKPAEDNCEKFHLTVEISPVTCSMQKKGNISNDERTLKACETTQISLIDFGNNDVGPEGKLRTFLSYPHCRRSLDLQEGKTYLVMGSSKDIELDAKDELTQYALGERTWIEYWPTIAECQAREHRFTCLGMEELAVHIGRAAEAKALQHIVRTAEKIMGISLPSIQDIFQRRCAGRTSSIVKDPSHPSHNLLAPLPSG
ncbi:complement C3-like [Symphorus nematophorus]